MSSPKRWQHKQRVLLWLASVSLTKYLSIDTLGEVTEVTGYADHLLFANILVPINNELGLQGDSILDSRRVCEVEIENTINHFHRFFAGCIEQLHMSTAWFAAAQNEKLP